MSGPPDAARAVLAETFGFSGFRPGQEAVIRTILSGRSALAVMPTGSGKSLCFQIPALVTGGLTVVVSPLVALMRDQVAALGILSAVSRSGERFGAAHLIDVLRGRKTEKVERFGHDSMPAFGAGAERSAAEWRSLIRQMIAAGFLWLDIGGYGGIGITEKGRMLQDGEGGFIYRKDTVAAPRAARTQAHGDGPAERQLSERETALLDVLKALRLEIAKERKVPAYVVFHDRTLIEMARLRPRTEAEFAEINGVGAAKLEAFAEPFLAAIDQALTNG